MAGVRDSRRPMGAIRMRISTRSCAAARPWCAIPVPDHRFHLLLVPPVATGAGTGRWNGDPVAIGKTPQR
jgi:hypothetical protein